MSHFTTLRANRANLTVERKMFLRQEKYWHFYSKCAIFILSAILPILARKKNQSQYAEEILFWVK